MGSFGLIGSWATLTHWKAQSQILVSRSYFGSGHQGVFTLTQALPEVSESCTSSSLCFIGEAESKQVKKENMCQ